ncbi:MAG TPA: putative Ig domain-containing protein, partial [Verrucomicrobiae bacterium]|nr:putative Ig domain-containing protein [Verrucomicrobiae bacterium]
SALSVSGMQGRSFSYAIQASNGPVVFSAAELPPGINFNPATGVISGFPLVSGSFPVSIGASNQYGGDSQILSVNIASAAPIITSALTATGTEEQAGFAYTIRATNSPLTFGAAGLPLGLNINTNTGAITGTPLYGGVFNVLISAANAWGTATNTLQLNLNYAFVSTLFITDVSYNYSSPYLLNFAFSLRTDTNVSAAHAVVRPPSQLQVVCFEDGRPIGNETSVTVQPGSKKQLKTFLVLDYTFSMFALPGAIGSMQTDANALISALPADAQFGIYEFHSDSVDPQIVANLTSDKAALGRDIGGILTNYVQNDFAGSRVWDALYDALGQFGQTNSSEQHYVVLRSDGNDDSSQLAPTNGTVLDALVNMAQTNGVRIFCVGYGNNVNAVALQQLAFQTGGRFFNAGNAPGLDTEFAQIAKDADGQYLLQWATLKRAPAAFQPGFQVTVDVATADFNTAMNFATNIVIITNPPPAVTNFVLTNLTLVPLYSPTNYSGDIQGGVLHLAADPYAGPQTIRLTADYVPRYVRAFRINYRPNYPCVASLSSTGPGEILNGWSLTETNDGSGGRWLTLVSANPTNLLTSIPYGATGDLVTFQFQFPEKLTAQKAFSAFSLDNNIYGVLPPTGQTFQLLNASQFITVYPPPPPYGTPIPWLVAYGFTNNFAAAELSDPNGNGFAVWQDYLAGLNPRDPNSKFVIQPFSLPQPGQPPQITFSTVVGRTYRVETSTTLGGWTVLQDYISGTGGNVSVTDERNLSSVSSVFYRVVVY